MTDKKPAKKKKRPYKRRKPNSLTPEQLSQKQKQLNELLNDSAVSEDSLQLLQTTESLKELAAKGELKGYACVVMDANGDLYYYFSLHETRRVEMLGMMESLKLYLDAEAYNPQYFDEHGEEL